MVSGKGTRLARGRFRPSLGQRKGGCSSLAESARRSTRSWASRTDRFPEPFPNLRLVPGAPVLSSRIEGTARGDPLVRPPGRAAATHEEFVECVVTAGNGPRMGPVDRPRGARLPGVLLRHEAHLVCSALHEAYYASVRGAARRWLHAARGSLPSRPERPFRADTQGLFSLACFPVKEMNSPFPLGSKGRAARRSNAGCRARTFRAEPADR